MIEASQVVLHRGGKKKPPRQDWLWNNGVRCCYPVSHLSGHPELYQQMLLSAIRHESHVDKLRHDVFGSVVQHSPASRVTWQWLK